MGIRARLAWALVGLGACSGGEGDTSSVAGGKGTSSDQSPSIGDEGNDGGAAGDGVAAGDGADADGEGGNGESGDGANDDDANGQKPDDALCDDIVVSASPTIPEMLIVLDKSGSMVWVGCDSAPSADPCLGGDPKPPFDEPFDRWQPSVAAIKRITQELQTQVSFGLMTFPGEGSLFSVCDAGTMRVAPGLNSAADIATALDAERPDGTSTPIPGTLRAVRDFFRGKTSPDQRLRPRYVLLVTDGAPNCNLDGKAAGGLFVTQEQCQMQSYQEVSSLLGDDIQTFVIGYDTADIPDLDGILDEMARRGGTGDTEHRAVENEQSLLDQISAIAGNVTSCTYAVEKPVEDPKYVRVTLDGTDVASGEDGWVLANPNTIELRGEACALLQDRSTEHALRIRVECKPVVVE